MPQSLRSVQTLRSGPRPLVASVQSDHAYRSLQTIDIPIQYVRLISWPLAWDAEGSSMPIVSKKIQVRGQQVIKTKDDDEMT